MEEQVDLFAEKIYQKVPAEAKANQLLRESLILRGIDPDAQSELSPELAAKLAEGNERSNDDLYFSGDLHAGKEFKGKKITGDKDLE